MFLKIQLLLLRSDCYCIDRISGAFDGESDVVLVPPAVENRNKYKIGRVVIYHLTELREENKTTFESRNHKPFSYSSANSCNGMFKHQNDKANEMLLREYNYNMLPTSAYVRRKSSGETKN